MYVYKNMLHNSYWLCISLCTFHTYLLFSQSTLNLSNPNFFSVLVESVSCQVLYMKTVIGTQQLDNATTILPLSESQVKWKIDIQNAYISTKKTIFNSCNSYKRYLCMLETFIIFLSKYCFVYIINIITSWSRHGRASWYRGQNANKCVITVKDAVGLPCYRMWYLFDRLFWIWVPSCTAQALLLKG